MIYNYQTSSLEEHLEKDNPFTILSLAIEMFKVSNNLASTIISNIIHDFFYKILS